MAFIMLALKVAVHITPEMTKTELGLSYVTYNVVLLKQHIFGIQIKTAERSKKEEARR